ncbi:MAG TPA: fimbria/pilus periplasmic chaperone [Nitrospirota bacterium]|nr:fimbria/pilus periplasmic chaperone [Nitrospirota bacterium]
MNNIRYIRSLPIILAAICCFGGLFSAYLPASAADFRVSPIRLDLGQSVKSGAINVANDGEGQLNLQISVSEWSQDAEGKDVYTDTSDIVFFPKIMTVDAGEQRVIRVGIKGAPQPREKTYRIFIEQIPERNKGKGVNLAISIRFAPPIFVMPAVVKTEGAIDAIQLSNGKVKAIVKNTGNVHFKILSILMKGKAADGSEVFSKELSGFYLLNHIARALEAPISAEKCEELSTVEIEARTEDFNLNGKLNVQKGMCSQ